MKVRRDMKLPSRACVKGSGWLRCYPRVRTRERYNFRNDREGKGCNLIRAGSWVNRSTRGANGPEQSIMFLAANFCERPPAAALAPALRLG
jgi:hypothetical protein